MNARGPVVRLSPPWHRDLSRVRGEGVPSRVGLFWWIGLVLVAVGCEGGPAPLDAGPAADARPSADAELRVDAGPPEELDAFIAYQMEVGGIPGLAAAVVLPNEITWVGTYGYADVAGEIPVDDRTLFIIASLSKMFVAVRALQLVEAEALDLDVAVDDYLPYPARHPDHPDTPLSARMLLTHSSGLTDDLLLLGTLITVGDSDLSLRAFSQGYVTPEGDYFSDANWGARPGSRRAYCNAGFGVLGDLLEVAGAADFSEQTRAHIFEPLQMDGAGWFLADLEPARLAKLYSWNGRRPVELEQNGFAFYPATSLRVSAVGLGRFAQALLSGGALDGERVLESESVDELLRPQIPALDPDQALAFNEERLSGHEYIGHSGSTYGASARFLMSRDGTHAIFVMTNSDAYVRSRLGFTEGSAAIRAVLRRLHTLAQESL